MELEFTADPQAFLDAAGDHLAADPVLNTVVATVAARSAGEGTTSADDWYLTVRDDAGVVVGVAMRTAQFPPRPAYVLPMPADAARLAARAVHARG